MKFKLDENLSPSLATPFTAAGHDAHSVVQQSLGGQPHDRVIEVCRREGRVLVMLDLDFSNILAYPPANFMGICASVGRSGTFDGRVSNGGVL